MAKKKVLFTSHVASFQKFNRPLIDWFHEQGWKVHYASMGEEEITGCDKVFVVPFARSPFSFSNIVAIRKLKKIIDEENYDLIHTHTPMGSIVTRLAARAARKKGTKVIYTAHGFHFFKGAPLLNWLIYYPIEKMMAKLTDTLITINDEDYQCAKKNFRTNVQYVPGVGVDPDKFTAKMSMKEKNAKRKELGLGKSDFVMIYVAELLGRKNQLWLVKTLEPFFKENPDAHLLLPGKDSLNGKLHSLVNELELQNQVHILGFRKDIPQLMEISNLAVSSSKQEGLPVNIMEAMYLGLPVVATNCRGNRDLIQGSRAGIIVDQGDDKAFRHAVCSASTNRTKSKIGQSNNLKRYSTELVMKRMEEIYGFSISGSRPNIAILTTGLLPVPAVLGGAVESLTQNFIAENEQEQRAYLTIYSSFDKEAAALADRYKMAKFEFIKTPRIVSGIDLVIYFTLKTVLRTKKAASARALLRRAYFMRKVSKLIAKNNHDRVLFENAIVQMHTMAMNRNWERYADRVYIHIHNEITNFYGARDHLLKSKIITVSDFVKNSLITRLNSEGIDTSYLSIATLKNSVDNHKFQEVDKKKARERVRQLYGITGNDRVILFSGRLTPDKGVDVLIRSLAHVTNNAFKLLIVGSSFFGTGIKNPFLRELHVITRPYLDKVHFTGYVDYRDMPQIYKGCDFAVLPSVCNDAAPLTVIESVTSCLPVITTRQGGIPEYVDDKSAILLDANDHLERNLAESIDNLLSNPERLISMSQAEYTLAKSMTLKKYYRGLLKMMDIDHVN